MGGNNILHHWNDADELGRERRFSARTGTADGSPFLLSDSVGMRLLWWLKVTRSIAVQLFEQFPRASSAEAAGLQQQQQTTAKIPLRNVGVLSDRSLRHLPSDVQ